MNPFTKILKFYPNASDRIQIIGLPLLLLCLGTKLFYQSNSSQAPSEDPTVADKYIPKGYVLIPVQLENHQSIDSLVGGQAVVNIYRNQGGGKSTLMGRNLRMLRAPLNPQQFAVLIPESQVNLFVTGNGKLLAVLQNSDLKSGTEIQSLRKSPTIQYY